MTKNLFKISFVLFFVWFFWSAGQAKADAPVMIHLEVETATTTLFNGSVDVSACPEFPGSATTTINGLCALEQAGLSPVMNWAWVPSGWISSIGGVSEDNNAGIYWAWFHDLNLGDTGINQHLLRTNEYLLFTLAISPLKISTSNSSPFDGATTTISAMQFNPDVNIFDWVPAANATIDFGYGTTTTDINGQADIMATSSAPFSVSAAKTNFLSSNILDITPQAAYANITIRNGLAIIFSDTVALPTSNAAAVNISPTGATSTVAVPARSLLLVLETVDAAQNEFAISDLQYYSSFDSFFINCLTIAAETNPLCGSWQYTLNAVDPGVGTDHALLKNGDTIFLYFGTPRQVSLSTAAATVGVPFTATAQKYDPVNNIYTPIIGITIGVTQPNPNDPWNPTEVATSTVDANGQAVFTLNASGTYGVGIKIKEDFYFSLTTLTVASSSPANNQTNNQISGGSVIIPSSGGGSSIASAAKVDLSKAVDFLISKQSADGSFGSALQTDWAAIALAAANPNGSAAQKVKSYLLTDPNPLGGMNQVSDYARRAMALMSLNVSPYSGTKTNYVKKIIDLFDGRQFGDAALYNDDIFALLVLNKAGYGASDEMIKQTAAFIISKQQANGLWDSIDLTAAVVQALTPLSAVADTAPALSKARNFLSNAQKADGGFGDTYATSWVMQAIAALGENAGSWQKNNNTPESYLALSQGTDGGLEKNSSLEVNRLWSTAYAIPAVSAKPWFNILNGFNKQGGSVDKKIMSGDSKNSANNLIATSTSENTATSSSQILNQEADAAEIFLLAEADNKTKENKPVKLETKRTAKAVAGSVKSLAPQVLAEKIVRSKSLPATGNLSEKQDSESRATAETLTNKSSVPNQEVKGAGKETTAQNKINDKAKKALYVAGAGTILAGVLLLLKLLGFLL